MWTSISVCNWTDDGVVITYFTIELLMCGSAVVSVQCEQKGLIIRSWRPPVSSTNVEDEWLPIWTVRGLLLRKSRIQLVLCFPISFMWRLRKSTWEKPRLFFYNPHKCQRFSGSSLSNVKMCFFCLFYFMRANSSSLAFALLATQNRTPVLSMNQGTWQQIYRWD